jgi:Tol biopolymer transport system component
VAPSPSQVAFTRDANVFLLPANGGSTSVVTTRGSARYNGIHYPAYAWSPDGKYLLLVRDHGGQSFDLLLLDPTGTVLRTLVSDAPAFYNFQPGWAVDADRIAYVATISTGNTNLQVVVNQVDLTGHISPLWSYHTIEGCGGGTSDPSGQLYWSEVGYEGVAPTLQWSTRLHLAIYTGACIGTVNVTNLQTGATERFGSGEVALSTTGLAAAVHYSDTSGVPEVVLVDPRTGAVRRDIARGELPHWSPDGHTLYFVQRTQQQNLGWQDELGNSVGTTIFSSAIWQANSDGSHLARLTKQDAYGFGPLHTTPDGKALIFAWIDNSWNLWRHRQAGNRVPDSVLAQYGPTTSVRRLDLATRSLKTLATNAGRPEVQP